MRHIFNDEKEVIDSVARKPAFWREFMVREYEDYLRDLLDAVEKIQKRNGHEYMHLFVTK